MEERDDEARAAHPQRMAERDGAAVDVPERLPGGAGPPSGKAGLQRGGFPGRGGGRGSPVTHAAPEGAGLGGKAPRLIGGPPPPLRLERERVLILTRHAPPLRDV